MKVKASNIIWETDGQEIELPNELQVEVEEGLTDFEIENELCEKLSDITGWLVIGFDYETI
jgi:hypothetical protein